MTAKAVSVPTLPLDSVSLLSDSITLFGEALYDGLEKIRVRGIEGILAEEEEVKEEPWKKKKPKGEAAAAAAVAAAAAAEKEKEKEAGKTPPLQPPLEPYDSVVSRLLEKITKTALKIDTFAALVAVEYGAPASSLRRRFEELGGELGGGGREGGRGEREGEGRGAQGQGSENYIRGRQRKLWRRRGRRRERWRGVLEFFAVRSRAENTAKHVNIFFK